jgi:hypothetical protein
MQILAIILVFQRANHLSKTYWLPFNFPGETIELLLRAMEAKLQTFNAVIRHQSKKQEDN